MVKDKELKDFKKYVQHALEVFKGVIGSTEFIQVQPQFNSIYLNYQLLKHSKRLEKLTFALIFLTIVLLASTVLNIWLLIN